MPIKKVIESKDPNQTIQELNAQLFEANAIIGRLEQKLDGMLDTKKVEYVDIRELDNLIDKLTDPYRTCISQGGIFFTPNGFFVRIMVLDPVAIPINSKVVAKTKWLTLTGLHRTAQDAVKAAIDSPVLADYVSSHWPELLEDIPEPVVEPTTELEAVVLNEVTGEPGEVSPVSSGVDAQPEIEDEELDEPVEPAPWSTVDEMTVYLDSLVGKQVKAKGLFAKEEDPNGGYSTGIYLGAMEEDSGRILHKLRIVVGHGATAKVKARVIVPETVRELQGK